MMHTKFLERIKFVLLFIWTLLKCDFSDDILITIYYVQREKLLIFVLRICLQIAERSQDIEKIVETLLTHIHIQLAMVLLPFCFELVSPNRLF